MSSRKGVPEACDKKCSPWCAIKEKLDALWDRTHNAFTSLNGVEGDGTGNLQIEAGDNISLEQSGNRIKITGEGGGVEYTARSPLDIYENEIFARMGPVQEGWTWLVSADNIDRQIKAQIQAEANARDTQIGTQVASEASARGAADDDLQAQIDDIEDGTVAVGRATHAVDADTAGTANALSGVLPQANGGTGGTGLKTINGESIVGSGDIHVLSSIPYQTSSIYSPGVNSTRDLYFNITIPSGQNTQLCLIYITVSSPDLPEDNVIRFRSQQVPSNNLTTLAVLPISTNDTSPTTTKCQITFTLLMQPAPSNRIYFNLMNTPSQLTTISINYGYFTFKLT